MRMRVGVRMVEVSSWSGKLGGGSEENETVSYGKVDGLTVENTEVTVASGIRFSGGSNRLKSVKVL